MHRFLRRPRLVGIVMVAALTAGLTFSTSSPAWASNHERIQNYQGSVAAYVDSIGVFQPVRLWQFDGSTKYEWQKIPVAGGAYLFQNWSSGLCMTVGGNRLDGAPILQTLCDPLSPIQWWFRVLDPNLPVWHIRNGFTGLYLSTLYCFCFSFPMYQALYSPTDQAQMWQMWG